MARQQNLGMSAEWFVGEDKSLPFEVYSQDEATIENVTGWAMQWVLRRVQGGDDVKLSKTTSGGGVAISGTYNADPAVNTQRVTVTVADTDTQFFQPGLYMHTLKRTDAGFATVLAYGQVFLKKAAL